MKIIKLFMVALITITMTACSNNQETVQPNKTSQSEEITVDEGLLNVKVVLPAVLFENSEDEITQEKLDEDIKDFGFKSATLNEDGSVTYIMSKKQHREFLEEMTTSIETSLQEMVENDTDFSFEKIEHNKDFTEFTVTCDTYELVGFGNAFSSLIFYMYGYYYNAFAGNTNNSIIKITYVNPDGEVIEESQSDEMENLPVEDVTDGIPSN